METKTFVFPIGNRLNPVMVSKVGVFWESPPVYTNKSNEQYVSFRMLHWKKAKDLETLSLD